MFVGIIHEEYEERQYISNSINRKIENQKLREAGVNMCPDKTGAARTLSQRATDNEN
jgi:hypothetical protein